MKTRLLYLAAGAVLGLFCLAATTDSSVPPQDLGQDDVRRLPTSNPNVPSRGGYLVVTVPSGEYLVDRRDVMSVSCHHYEIAGGMRVWEVTVSERSSNTARWYYTKPMTAKEKLLRDPNEEKEGGKLDSQKTSGAARTNTDDATQSESRLDVPVRKEFPHTTHAHCIEYRVANLAKLEDIYNYFALKVYGWSPRVERSASARELKPLEIQPLWRDWSDHESD